MQTDTFSGVLVALLSQVLDDTGIGFARMIPGVASASYVPTGRRCGAQGAPPREEAPPRCDDVDIDPHHGRSARVRGRHPAGDRHGVEMATPGWLGHQGFRRHSWYVHGMS